ncbi:MAG: TetR/AcrR family transcriptional regulator [Planctomycetia bacterium]|nr:TetR/AcrR family transcriptional regulator [Planctomycetia bacterium]
MRKGRPREFDVEQALEQALQVFWRKGYEGTSLPDLTAAMGINRPSLYAAFGNKEALFRRAVERYVAGPAAFVRQALAEPTARAVAERLLHGSADLLTRPGQPPGCLVVQGALACGKEADPIRQELAARRAAAQTALRKRLQRARTEGDLPTDADPADLARYLTAVMHGMAVQAVGGASRAELRRVAELALRVWPPDPANPVA